ncbi:hypothetical protein [Hyphobacterium sp.]|jgi:hypothetical protein|uniref:hypothetical protein n=1 Tax=Hyphobacterium sp. TaxID=2004662 RepID=UPI003BAB5B4C
MANGGDQGFFLGMMASRRARERRAAGEDGQTRGGGALFNIFPLMVIPVIIYSIVALIGGQEAVSSVLFSLTMVSGEQWNLSLGDILIILGLIFLFIETVKAAGSGTATIMNHGLSMLVFVICLALFLLVGSFATSVFFILMSMTLIDTLAGFIITIVAARRDLAVAE